MNILKNNDAINQKKPYSKPINRCDEQYLNTLQVDEQQETIIFPNTQNNLQYLSSSPNSF